MERSTRIQGEAGRTADQMGKQFAFLKRDLSELADNVSGLVLPALSGLARYARDLTGILAGVDQQTVKTFFGIAAGAALIGPALILVVKMIDGLFKLRAAFALLSAGAGATGFFAALAAAPLATVVAGIVAITGALGALYLVWQKFKSGPKDLLGGSDPTLNKALGIGPEKNPMSGLGGTNGATERSPAVDAMKQLEERAQNVTTALKQMGQGMEAPTALTAEWVKTFALVETAIDKIGNALDPVSVKLQGIANDMKDVAGALASPSFASLGNLPGVQAIGKSFTTAGLTSRINGPQEQALPGMSAANEAALRYAKTQQYATEVTAYEYQQLRSTLEQFGIHLKNVSERAQGAINILAVGFLQLGMQLVANFGGKGPAAGTGRQLGGLGGAALGFFLGGPVGAIAGSIAGTGIGGLIGGIFDHPKKEADTAANSMSALAKTVDRVNASISNMPQWFKIAGFRFAAASPILPAPPPPAYTPPTPNTPSGPTGGTPTDGATSNRSPAFHIQTLNVNSSATNVKQLLAEIEKAAFAKQATGAASGFAFAFQGT